MADYDQPDTTFTGSYQTHGGSMEEIQAALDEMSRDPKLVQMLASGNDTYVESQLAARGLSLPRHYKLQLGSDGRITPREQGKWERWKTPILATGAMLGGGFALEAALAAGAGSSGLTAAPMLGGADAGISASAIGVGGATGGATTAAAAGIPASTSGGWSALANASKYIKPGAAAINTAAQSLANNRGEKLSASQYGDQVATQRQAENRAEREDTWQKLQQASYLTNRSTTPQFANLSPYAPQTRRPVSPEELQGAEGLSREALLRLINGPQIKPLSDVDKLSKMGGWEKFLNIAGPVASTFAR